MLRSRLGSRSPGQTGSGHYLYTGWVGGGGVRVRGRWVGGGGGGGGRSECWMFYALLTSRVISRQKHVWTSSVLDENRFGLIQSWVIESMR